MRKKFVAKRERTEKEVGKKSGKKVPGPGPGRSKTGNVVKNKNWMKRLVRKKNEDAAE